MSSYAVRVERARASARAATSDAEYQRAVLPGVSRTFALTIPQLPDGLWEPVTTAYLLCRIADTIEDDAELGPEEKRRFQERFTAAVEGRADPDELARELAPSLSRRTPVPERELVENTARVVRLARALDEPRRAALVRCVRILCEGMAHYQALRPRAGLADVAAFEHYCYCVAGVVGELLTELFCRFDPTLAARREELESCAVSFGLALQMTNVLKDLWDDLERGVCWLPRDLFAAQGFELEHLVPGRSEPALRAGLERCLALAHGHLERALRYTLAIPKHQRGIRRFCLWALAMAVLNLRKLNARLDFTSSGEVKLRRTSVRATIVASEALIRSDLLLRASFAFWTRGLPAALESDFVSPGRDRGA